MDPNQKARRSDALFHDNTVSRRNLCDRIANLESLAQCVAYCIDGNCEDGCPMYEMNKCMAPSEIRLYGI